MVLADIYDGRRVIQEDFEWQAISAPTGGWTYETLPQGEERKARELFARGDAYELAGQRDYARACDLKALRHLEFAFLWSNYGHEFGPSPIGIVPSFHTRTVTSREMGLR